MRLLIDSHILLAITQRELSGKYGARIDLLIKSQATEKIMSVASLWEIAIKHRLNKLELALPLERFPGYFEELGLHILPISADHTLERLKDEPATKDLFDRLLLAQCQAENMQLVTVDRALADHPLVWRED